jgi:membrane protein implicated in regulation of membrane protease activity
VVELERRQGAPPARRAGVVLLALLVLLVLLVLRLQLLLLVLLSLAVSRRLRRRLRRRHRDEAGGVMPVHQVQQTTALAVLRRRDVNVRGGALLEHDLVSGARMLPSFNAG